ncbi:MAG TPA: hypothetical protein VII75_16625 [Thermoanaerobaculia bacterium]|nr:hypothetical protein [Thermoanaerobaculia bacterium]
MMTRAQVVYLQLCVLITALTGIVFAVMKYGMKSDDPFAVVNHPLQPAMLAAHVVIAPLLVFGFGWIFGNHIWPGFTSGIARKRKSGLWSMGAIAPMVVSAYLLQISTADATRQAMAIAHWISSALFVIAYVIHLVTKKAARSARRAAEASAPYQE